jgi:hypothetical protein
MSRIFRIMLFAVALALSGCTTEMAYRTVQAAAEQACLRQPESEQAQCRSRIISQDYPSYEKSRKPN